jgi:hypothetical protein
MIDTSVRERYALASPDAPTSIVAAVATVGLL